VVEIKNSGHNHLMEKFVQFFNSISNFHKTYMKDLFNDKPPKPDKKPFIKREKLQIVEDKEIERAVYDKRTLDLEKKIKQ
jgi:dimeric dUTPase (all-alpha-NTP-PPase superfamily)